MSSEVVTRAGSGADSDAESIFSSVSYPPLSDGSDEEGSDEPDALHASSHAFKKLKDLLQQRDKQFALSTDQQPSHAAPLAETSEKTLEKVRSVQR